MYANETRFPLGQLSSFDIDFDATGEKNFEMTIDNFILRKGYWIFIPNTEIGGIVDSVTVNTEDESVRYTGRNFRGILNDKVISVPSGQSSVSVQGNIQDVINNLLEQAGIGLMFTCKTPKTEYVNNYIDYVFQPFCTLYDGIMAMAQAFNYKLIFSYNAQTSQVEITPMLIENFTDFLVYTKNSSIALELSDNSMSTNHFILVGYGEENERYQIDLFVNENAQIMDFATVINPMKDSDYILDDRNQVYFGIEEKTKCEISDSVSPIENYEYLSNKPSDWADNYGSYYYQETEEEDGETKITYKNYKTEMGYRLLSSQPSDWLYNYGAYFIKNGDEYESVDPVSSSTDDYVKVDYAYDWETNYKNYYYKVTDGLTYRYEAVSGITDYVYKKQKYRPTDWSDNWASYYVVNKVEGETTYDPAGTYYTKNKQGEAVKKTRETAPKWEKNKYYTRQSVTLAPLPPHLETRDVYTKVTTNSESAPNFYSGTYYERYESPPAFYGCYQKVSDHYGGMISKLLEKLEVFPVNKQQMSIVDFEADIGDVVGGYDKKTNITLSAPIINIIYRIERGVQRSIEYVIGG